MDKKADDLKREEWRRLARTLQDFRVVWPPAFQERIWFRYCDEVMKAVDDNSAFFLAVVPWPVQMEEMSTTGTNPGVSEPDVVELEGAMECPPS